MWGLGLEGVKMELKEQLIQTRQASKSLMHLSLEKRQGILERLKNLLLENEERIIEENQKDLKEAIMLSESMKERLTLNHERIVSMAKQVEIVMGLSDPLNRLIESMERPNGLKIEKRSIPLGVIAMIYESRPNVTIDVAALCIKSGNACVLKGGKEAKFSNQILVNLIHQAIGDTLSHDSVAFIHSSNQVEALIQSKGLIDVVVPRGGKGLIDFVVTHASVPVIETGAGICHVYVDKEANLEKSLNVVMNAKASRPSVCNSIETVLVHQDVALTFLPLLKKQCDELAVLLKGDLLTQKVISVESANEKDYATEYNDYILNIKVVENIEEAIDHIERFSTKHSESIMSENKETAKYFVDHLDSACVYINASTRFSDGGEFGYGLELGISTQKLHARGPLGLNELTTYRYVIYGEGQIRE